MSGTRPHSIRRVPTAVFEYIGEREGGGGATFFIAAEESVVGADFAFLDPCLPPSLVAAAAAAGRSLIHCQYFPRFQF